MSKAKFIDGRNYPPYCVLYTRELLSPEVMALPNAALQIWLCLNMACNKRDADVERSFYMSWDRLIHATGLSRASVGRGLKLLERSNLIHRKRRGLGKQNVLILCTPPSLIPKTVKLPVESHSCDPGSHGGEPMEGSADDTLNISPNTSSFTSLQEEAPTPSKPHETQEEAATLWRSIVSLVEAEIGYQDVEIWIEAAKAVKLTAIGKGKRKLLTLVLPNIHYIEWWNDNYTAIVQNALEESQGIGSKLRLTSNDSD